MWSLSFVYRFLSLCAPPRQASPSSLCVLPHGFPPQQCVALVITSCLKQTDGIRESDGQFSQCMCRLLRFCACVPHACMFLFLFPATTPQPLHPTLQVFCMAGVCTSVCVHARTWGITWHFVLVQVGQPHLLSLHRLFWMLGVSERSAWRSPLPIFLFRLCSLLTHQSRVCPRSSFTWSETLAIYMHRRLYEGWSLFVSLSLASSLRI